MLDAIEVALDVALDLVGGLDAEEVEDRGDDVHRMVVLLPDLPGGGLVARPADDARVGRPAIELVPLPHLERCVEGHRPAVRVVVVGRRTAQFVELGQVRLEVVWDPVEQQALVDRSVRPALPARAVVGHEDDQRVVALAGLLEVVEQSADLVVGVREEAGVDLGHAGEQPLLVVGERVPGLGVLERWEWLAVRPLTRLWRAERIEGGQGRVRRDEAHLLLAGEGLLAHRLVAHVESALEPVDPVLRSVVRRVRGAGFCLISPRLAAPWETTEPQGSSSCARSADFDFDFLRPGRLGFGNHDLEDSVLVVRGDLARIRPCREVERA